MNLREDGASAVPYVVQSNVPQRMARGWHCLGLADQYKDGKPHGVFAFNTKLVVFQNQQGALSVLDAYCPHMGGDLSQGTVRGDSVACPFHDWRWGDNGRCTAIPYAKHIPVRARTRKWHALEENRLLFIWHDPEGKAPPPEVAIPRIDGLFDDTWSQWDMSVHKLATTGRELVDNLVDAAHFFYVHGEGKGAGASYFKNVFDGHVAWQFLEMGTDPDAPATYPKDKPGVPAEEIAGWMRGETRYYGPAYLHSHLMNRFPGDTVEFIEILAQVPVTPETFRLYMGFSVKKRPDLSEEQNAARTRAVAERNRIGTLQDVHIWEHKTRVDNPLLCDTDGPVYQLRRWYEQFFVDVADIKPEMTARLEIETDTRHALPVWDRQAAEKIAEEQGNGA
ncbi:Rieske 2Fe-2S domain-containing protein [Paraburkholderia sp. HP33-1]|uniref:Rieske 2Fe-2S domain-containing protein n=1 Tax=Paraburkholderia sp. HP33-1 TaxID=2883243 RepID=UPI001F191A43|nr:Rieske 2Fe-2S domain-containing protein [Paraburkholderia sp. HP33-1]